MHADSHLTPNGGQVEYAPVKSLTPRTAQERLQVLLAGRAAEICVFNHPSSGAGAGEHSDLAKATSLALAIERHWGFGDSGLLWDGVSAEDVWRAPADVRERVEAHLRKAQDKAEVTLLANRTVLEALAKELLRVRDMSGRDIAAFTEDVFREEHSRNDRAPSEGHASCVARS